MWNVKGNTKSGVEVTYPIAAGRDTEKAFVMALAFQEHGTKSPEDPMKLDDIEVIWTSDNVKEIYPVNLVERHNYSVERQAGKGKWERHSVRALRTPEAATEALETAASEEPAGHFRIRQTTVVERVIYVSKNTRDKPAEHLPPKESKGDTQESLPTEGEPAEADTKSDAA